MDLFRLFADHFAAPQAEQISSDSLRSKYHNVADNTARAIRELLLDLVNFSKKHIP